MLLINYVGAIALAFVEGSGFNTPVMAGVHGVLATLLIFRTWKLNAAGWVAEDPQGRAGAGLNPRRAGRAGGCVGPWWVLIGISRVGHRC